MQGITNYLLRLTVALLLSLSLNQFTLAATESTNATVAAAAQRLNINQASVEQLSSLPGIGPVKAEALVAKRTERGGFTSLEQLTEVKGIGIKTVEKLEPFISF